MSIPSVVKSLKSDNEIRRIYHEERFQDIEIKLNYVFQNKAYLISAFTHPSVSKYSVVDSYEKYEYLFNSIFSFQINLLYFRLEFLGDALLDLLVIRHVFLNYRDDLTPGSIYYYYYLFSYLIINILFFLFRSNNRYSTRFI